MIPFVHREVGGADERIRLVADIQVMQTNPVLVAAWLGALNAAARHCDIDPRLVERMARQIELANALFVKRRPVN